MNRKSKTVVGSVVLSAFFFMLGVRQYYTLHMPKSADTPSGRTIPMLVNYGITVYVTATEERLLYGMYVVAALGFGVVIVLVALEFNRKV